MAQLVGIAEPIARCGERSREFRRGEIAERHVRPLVIVSGGPSRQRRSGVIEIIEDRLIEQFVTHAAVERLADPVRHRFSGAMKCQAIRLLWAQASIALEVNSVPWSETIGSGLPRRAMIASSSRATLRLEIEVSAMAARHTLVTSSITLRMRKRRRFESWSWAKSTDQRALGLASTRIGARMPVAACGPCACGRSNPPRGKAAASSFDSKLGPRRAEECSRDGPDEWLKPSEKSGGRGHDQGGRRALGRASRAIELCRNAQTVRPSVPATIQEQSLADASLSESAEPVLECVGMVSVCQVFEGVPSDRDIAFVLISNPSSPK